MFMGCLLMLVGCAAEFESLGQRIKADVICMSCRRTADRFKLSTAL
jgi:hypothetical protein